MRTSFRFTWTAAVMALAMIGSALAADFGKPNDVEQVRKAVPKKLGKVLHVSISHEWALCTTYSGEDALSVALHRTGTSWKVAASDGGAYDVAILKSLGVPSADIPALLKVYQ